MARTQLEILIETIANLHIQLSASLARQSELQEANVDLANRLLAYQSNLSPIASRDDWTPSSDIVSRLDFANTDSIADKDRNALCANGERKS